MTKDEALKNVEMALDDLYQYFASRMDEQDAIMNMIDIMKSKTHNETIGYNFK